MSSTLSSANVVRNSLTSALHRATSDASALIVLALLALHFGERVTENLDHEICFSAGAWPMTSTLQVRSAVICWATRRSTRSRIAAEGCVGREPGAGIGDAERAGTGADRHRSP